MIANDIISSILNRYKDMCSSYPQSPSFAPNTKGDSFYLIRNRGEGLQPTQIRLSNHGTYLETWCDRNELGDSVERLNPAFCVIISIVFVDKGEDLTDDCKGMPNCDNCKIEPCKPQTFEGQDQIGRPFTVIQYVYSSKCIRRRYINGLTKAIVEASTKGKYTDPLADLYRAAKEKEFHSSTKLQTNKELKPENQQYKNMNKKLIRLTESDLHRIVKESVNRILMESETTVSDMLWSDGDLININTHEATYYLEDEDGEETIEFDCYDKDNGIPFVIEPVFDTRGFDEWDNDMIVDIEWGVSYYAPKNIKDLYNQYKQAIDNIMNANKDYFLARVRDKFRTP